MAITVLTIAGFDPSGGAGLGADLKTITALRCHGAGAVTAVTAQNTRGVKGIHAVPHEFLGRQVRTLVSDMNVRAVKIGMLANARIVSEVATLIDELSLNNVVLDPVLRSSSGTDLLDAEGIDALRRELLHRAHVITPNLAEAARLAARSVTDVAEMKEAAREIHRLGARQVVVTGGHLSGRSVDVSYDGSEFALFDGSRIPDQGTHGLGCAFSTAIACGLARGSPLVPAVEDAKRYVSAALQAAYRAGKGSFLLDHGVVWDGGRRSR